MSLTRCIFAIALTLLLCLAQPPLPELRTEPADGGSIFYVRNTSAQPLTGYLIELVNYPGSSYSLWQDEVAGQPIQPGAEKKISVGNMTVGAVPDYVKLQAAIYADGTSAGIPEKIAQLVERRRYVLETTRELIRRIEKAQSAGTPKATLAAGLKEWADSMQPAGKGNRASQLAINQAAARTLVSGNTASLEKQSVDEVLSSLRSAENALAASKPNLSNQ